MQTLHLGDTLALYINRTDLDALGLTPSEHDLATLARRALAESGSPGDADIALEVYPGGASSDELLLFCSPLARETVAFPTLAAAIDAAKHLPLSSHASLYLTEHNLWLLTLRAAPRRAALLAAVAAEFGERASVTPAYLSEHAKLLIPDHAIETLSQL